MSVMESSDPKRTAEETNKTDTMAESEIMAQTLAILLNKLTPLNKIISETGFCDSGLSKILENNSPSLSNDDKNRNGPLFRTT
jgi:hypothetical protein